MYAVHLNLSSLYCSQSFLKATKASVWGHAANESQGSRTTSSGRSRPLNSYFNGKQLSHFWCAMYNLFVQMAAVVPLKGAL